MSQPKTLDTSPGTFGERGISVPFTTPMLSQARMRPNRQGELEFLLPSFNGGRGMYIMPWRSLPAVMTVTLHDRLLHDALLDLRQYSPETVRQAVLAVQATGVAGGDASLAAEKTLALDTGYQALTQFTLVTELLKLARLDAGDLLATGMTGTESRRLMRAALGQLAQRATMPAEEMVQRVETFTALIAPVGLPQCQQLGRLRMAVGELERTRASLLRWSTTDFSEVSQLAVFVADTAKAALDMSRDRLARLDARCRDLGAIAGDFRALRATVAEEVARIGWLMDGWPFLIRLWDSVSDRPLETQQSTMGELFRLAPLVPVGEGGKEPSAYELEALSKIQTRWLRMGEDWRTGALDMPAVMRIEALKATLS
ncbi:hypothetical protein UCD39_20300 [Nitrospirillum sp. BR 11752]|uniref:Uncharacterized protein n=1 Tax=Nitrospirillum amazonense TaxID=28077 RepID=A0A560GS70_9PROT|nr:hypothetical protein [Nitrospirillum amazonense]MEE3626292.1 hypothetical protein [Nitrospirillum sp. BR 11752]TWB36878.1 hypothetical protein FBZ90_116101 [Nitrospirillum amazonense]